MSMSMSMSMDKYELTVQAEIKHSQAVRGGDIDEAKYAVAVLETIENSPDEPVANIVTDALKDFVDILASGDGMRIGEGNPRARLDAALLTFVSNGFSDGNVIVESEPEDAPF